MRSLKITIILMLAAGICCGKREQATRPVEPPQQPTAPAQPAVSIVEPFEAKVLLSLSPFDHNRPEHKKQQCVLCHKRTNETTTAPVFPGHDACDRCHLEILNPTAQTQSKLCTACHAPGPIELMPNTKFVDFTTRLKQFGIRATSAEGKGFSHRDHMDPTKVPPEKAKCETCHVVEVGGINASMPSHPQCYSCHTHQKGQKLGECNVCHAPREISLRYSRSVGAAYSLYNFKHGSHTPQVIKASCDRCHRLVESTGAESRSDILQISVARGQRHKSSCWSCHVQSRENVCTKCHLGGPPAF
jgi:hypothetical protein